MAIFTIVFLLFLFIISLIITLFQIPTKISTLFQSKSSNPVIKNKNKIKTKSLSFRSNSSERKEELKNVFATFDKNKDGFITKQELLVSLKNIGISTSEKDVVEMVKRVDVNGDGLIDFNEFCELFESMMSKEDEDRNLDYEEDGDLKVAFDVFDGDKNGLISVEELGLVLESLGFKEGKEVEDCKKMISKVDVDGDGMINFQEFKKMMKNGVNLVSTS